MSSGGRWLTSDQAAAVLGVRRSTLYSYVSRGLVSREYERDGDGHRVSRFDRSEIVSLAETRTRVRAGALPVLIESDVSAVEPDGVLRYRGRSVAGHLVEAGGFESVAATVLQGRAKWPELPATWRIPGDAVPGGSGRRTDSVRAAILAAASYDPKRDDLSAEHSAIVAMWAVEAGCRAVTGRKAAAGSVATRLAATLAASSDPALIRCLDTAMILLIDHGLTASTVATRAAAGLRADPWMAILAGQCALSGSAQAAASRSAVEMLGLWLNGVAPTEAEPLPGFGHCVYTGADPRFELLIAEVRQLAPGLVAAVEQLCIEVARARSIYPNVDLALAALTLGADLAADSGEVLFTLARTIGLAAHAAEEYPHGLRLRPPALASQPGGG